MENKTHTRVQKDMKCMRKKLKNIKDIKIRKWQELRLLENRENYYRSIFLMPLENAGLL